MDIAWTVSGGRALGPAPFFICGIVNVTPDSFYDGGRHASTQAAEAHARALASQGAHILDVGGESSRPFADPVSPEEEQARVVPVVRALAADASFRTPLSVDTYHAATAVAALEAGAVIINDISACAFDPALIDVLTQYKPGYVLMHSQGRPEVMQQAPTYRDVVSEVRAFFEDKLAMLVKAGLPEDRIVLDPGIGFGKLLEHNLALLRHVDVFAALGRPVMAALSNKSMFQGLLGLAPGDRVNATQAATAVLASRGVRIHRVHEVALALEAVTVGMALAQDWVRT
ncbi:MAG: dihydropteroate synthase [Desulfovibrionaceae bacterium]